MFFEQALPLLRQGYRMAHLAHTRRGPKWIELEAGDCNTMSHLVLVYGEHYPNAYAGRRVPWLPSRCDLIEPGWFIVGDPLPRRAMTVAAIRSECERINGLEP